MRRRRGAAVDARSCERRPRRHQVARRDFPPSPDNLPLASVQQPYYCLQQSNFQKVTLYIAIGRSGITVWMILLRSAHARRPICTLRIYTFLVLSLLAQQAPCECSHPGWGGPRDPKEGPQGGRGRRAGGRALRARTGGRARCARWGPSGPWAPWGAKGTAYTQHKLSQTE